MTRTPVAGHAVVIGAGIAGLLAARVLADAFTHVTVIERDRLDPVPAPRKGVPQGRYPHAMQARGLEALEQLLPGLRHELTAAGAPPIDFCHDSRVYFPHGAPQPMASDIRIQPVSRPLLETAMRGRTLRLPGIHLRDGCTVTAITAHEDRGTVTGVTLLHRRRGLSTGTTESIPAELIVDASGRGSHLPDWLTALGWPRVTETIVDPRTGYAARGYRLTDQTAPVWRALFELPQPPHTPRGAAVLRVENDRLLVALQGAAGDHPPTDENGFHTFMKTLSCELYETVQRLEPDTTVLRYARTANCRRHYHRLSPWPDGLIVLGDAACVFNPVYAQGMTVAALEALALRDLLAQHPYPPTDLGRRFQRRLARITAWPWLLATLPDRAWQSHRPPPYSRAAVRYLDACQRLAPEDPRMFHDIARVTSSLSSPLLLIHPRHLIRVAASARKPK
ncbi:FAD-dependent monooxygenase [Streptomyces sp. NBC_00237]|uniref:FAD-dependent oxidoreductase n=1 Tax=Streptomyces sp. NBC_00237 TaxID=2975687 RepID=UPI00224E9D48|nr:FAD-dependent monooxygenase [Streptomyces sp. NBC_00237]MCX5205769.1 FAD-dependent monooxygenase [Streptomyces sp. NBC_00237]